MKNKIKTKKMTKKDTAKCEWLANLAKRKVFQPIVNQDAQNRALEALLLIK